MPGEATGREAVARGKAASRAALITAALEREMRRQAAEADATILREQGAADSLLARAIVLAYALDIARQPNSSRNGTSRQPDEVETGQPGG